MSYGQGNSHTQWLMIKNGLTNKHDQLRSDAINRAYIKDISNDEAILERKPLR